MSARKELKIKGRVFTLCLVFIGMQVTNALDECYKEDFGSGSLGIVAMACEKGSLFDVKKYEDYADKLPKPDGANDYFITPGADNVSCIESGQSFDVLPGSELQLSFFTSNPGAPIIGYWVLIDLLNGGQLGFAPLFIDNSKIWKTSNIKLTKKTTVKVKLECENLQEKNALLAIDYLRIKSPDVDDCVINLTTTTDDYTVTVTTTDDYTSTVTTTTDDYTDTTSTPSIATPEPPPNVITCNCNCNCNFQCDRNPFP